MKSSNTNATHKFVIVLNEKSPPGKLLSATGQLAMSLQGEATAEQRVNMDFIPFLNPVGDHLITLSTCSLVVLKGSASQLFTLYSEG